MLDTTVYIDVLQGRTPMAVDKMLGLRLCHHSAICLADLTHAFGRLDPSDPRTRTTLEIISETIADIPTHRRHAPSGAEWGRAGMLAGLLVRLSGRPAKQGHERKFLNDAPLQSMTLGCAVLTANIENFDLLDQIVPTSRVLLYRHADTSRPAVK